MSYLELWQKEKKTELKRQPWWGKLEGVQQERMAKIKGKMVVLEGKKEGWNDLKRVMIQQN